MKKNRIKELERRVALLEAEVAGLRGQQRIVWIAPPPGTAPVLPPNPWTNPWITCTSRTQVIKTDPSIKTYTWN